MALIVRDSFDPYFISIDLEHLWENPSLNTSLVSGTNTRFGVGQALRWGGGFGSNIAFGKTFFANEGTIFIVFAMQPAALNASSNDDLYFRLYDGTTVQCSIVFSSNGDLKVYRGDVVNTGTRTLLQTWPASYSGNVWTHWQIKVVIDNAAGEVHVRKNGNTSDDFTLTAVDLTMTANNYATRIDVGSNSNAGIQRTFDDLVIYSGDGPAPWNDFVGDIRCQQVLPNADTAQKDFVASNTATFGGTAANNLTGSQLANNIHYYSVVAPTTGVMGTAGQIYVNSPPGSGKHLTLGLYDSDGPSGTPGTLLAQVNLTSPVFGLNTFTLSNGINVVRGHTYFWGVVSEAPWNLYTQNLAALPQYTQAYTYNGTMPATANPIATTSISPLSISMPITPTNSGNVADLIYDFDATMVTADSVGDLDLYQPTPMTVTPSAILGLSIRVMMAKTDTQLREATLHLKSSATEVDGAPVVLASDYRLIEFVQDVDPATGVAWTPAGINNLEYGPKVVA